MCVADRIIKKITDYDTDIISIYLKGSMNDKENVDYWSDVDLLIISSKKKIDDVYIQFLDTLFGCIVGKQIYDYEGCVTYRVTGYNETICQYDIQILTRNFFETHIREMSRESRLIFGKDLFDKIHEEVQVFKHCYNPVKIDDIWFQLYECVKKFARHDNLIGSHIGLDIIRELLVYQMIDRDIEKNTNVHRFGGNEVLNDYIDLELFNSNIQADKIDLVHQIGNAFDNTLKRTFEEYCSRIQAFNHHIEKTKEHLNILK